MEKHQHGFSIICSIIVSFGLVAFIACVAAECSKTKAKEVKLDGKLCYLSGSPAFGLGIAASICLLVVQIVGNIVIGRQFHSRGEGTGGDGKAKKQSTAICLLVLSWISFGFAIILLATATSMNQRQPYGKGWLDGECYVVKDGVYVGSGVLALATVIFALGSILATGPRKQVEQGRKVPTGSDVKA